MSFSVRALESPITVSVAPTYKIPIDAYNRRIGGNCQILMTIVCAERERERESEGSKPQLQQKAKSVDVPTSNPQQH